MTNSTVWLHRPHQTTTNGRLVRRRRARNVARLPRKHVKTAEIPAKTHQIRGKTCPKRGTYR